MSDTRTGRCCVGKCSVMWWGCWGKECKEWAGSVHDSILHGLNMCAFIKARMKCRMNISWCSELWGWVEKCVLHALLERPAPRSDREQVTYKVMWILLNLSEWQGSQHFCSINEARGLRKTQVCYSDVWLKMRHPQSDTWETAQYFVFEHKSGVRALSSK